MLPGGINKIHVGITTKSGGEEEGISEKETYKMDYRSYFTTQQRDGEVQ